MVDRDRDLSPELEKRWREWAEADPAIDERALRRDLLSRIPERRSRHPRRLVLVAAAASLVVLLIGIESLRGPSRPDVFERPTMIHELGENTILILREEGEPIHVVIDLTESESGGTP